MKHAPLAIAATILAAAVGASAGQAPAKPATAKPDPAKKAAAVPKVRPEDLDPRFQAWLNLVAYHIQPVERDVFFRLGSDRERDLFVQAFWNQRDPTPGTPENEYKDEVEKRFEYVNKTYGRGTTRAGWKTDMGRIHMILGPPVSTESFEASLGLVPAVSWTYYGDVRKNLPTHFVLLFYKRTGVGEFKLYDPLADGPYQLLQNKRDVDPTDYETLYEKLFDISPTLADVAISLVPGEYGFNMTPSPRNAIILADILQSPRKDVNPAYASHFLEFKGLVSTEYMTNYVDSSAEVDLARDPATGLSFLHFSVVPASVNVDLYEPKNQLFCSYRLDVSLRDGDAIIFQYFRELPVYFDRNDEGRVRANGLALEDSFPVVEGTHRLTILLQNAIGKQFSVVERDITVPPPAPGPRIDAVLLGYKVDRYARDLHAPFKLDDRKIVVDPKNTFGQSDAINVLVSLTGLDDALRAGGEARLEISGLREKDPVSKTYRMRLSDPGLGRGLVLAQSFPAADLSPDYYSVRAVLAGPDGAVLDEKKQAFVVSPQNAVGHPIVNAKGVPAGGWFMYHYMLAEQMDKLGRNDDARARYEEAYRMNPTFLKGVSGYGGFLLKTGDFAGAQAVAERLKADEKASFEGLVLSGRALLGQGRFEDARAELLRANARYNSDTRVLTGLGLCFLRLGDKTQAAEALRASLKLDPGQDEAKKLLAEAEK